MDLFNRGKSKGKKKTDQPVIQTTNVTSFTNIPHSPKSPVLHPNDDYVTSGMSIKTFRQKKIKKKSAFL